jgi:prevent-host-death family protein
MKKAVVKEQRVGVRELKSNLSAILRQVKSGRAIVITERGKPVGRILPAEMEVEEALQEGVRKKLWAWSGRKWRPSPPKVRARGQTLVSDLLLDDRE